MSRLDDADYIRNIAGGFDTHVRASLERIADGIQKSESKLDRGFEMLEVCGVPRARCKDSIANGIDVLAARYIKEAQINHLAVNDLSSRLHSQQQQTSDAYAKLAEVDAERLAAVSRLGTIESKFCDEHKLADYFGRCPACVCDDYGYAASHADRGWAFLKTAVAALYKIASYGEGPEVTGSFDEPGSAKIAREALWILPSAGAYEGMGEIQAPAVEAQNGKCSAGNWLVYADGTDRPSERHHCELQAGHDGDHKDGEHTWPDLRPTLSAGIVETGLVKNEAMSRIHGCDTYVVGMWPNCGCEHPSACQHNPDRVVERQCTCHPDDNPPRPCPKKYALSECRKAAVCE